MARMWESKEIVNNAWHNFGIDCDTCSESMEAMLAGPPTTAAFEGKWAPITVVTSIDCSTRQSFCRIAQQKPKYGGRPIRITPSSPLHQRKKEVLLRAAMNAINMHDDWKDMELIPLWHTLTPMEPHAKREYKDGARAWLRIYFRPTPSGRV